MAAKKSTAPNKPILSRVPLPISDSALVIDLPDGQKLVIGKMNQGTVIEVATWRGVGRPDSRTNRMMFGMSSAEIDEESGSADSPSGSIANAENTLNKILAYPVATLKWLFNIKTTPKPRKNRNGGRRLIIDAKPQSPGIEGTANSSLTAEQIPLAATTGGKKKFTLAWAASLFSADALKPVIKKAIGVSTKVLRRKKIKNTSAPKSSAAHDQEIDDWLASITAKASKNAVAKTSKEGVKTTSEQASTPTKTSKKGSLK